MAAKPLNNSNSRPCDGHGKVGPVAEDMKTLNQSLMASQRIAPPGIGPEPIRTCKMSNPHSNGVRQPKYQPGALPESYAALTWHEIPEFCYNAMMLTQNP